MERRDSACHFSAAPRQTVELIDAVLAWVLSSTVRPNARWNSPATLWYVSFHVKTLSFSLQLKKYVLLKERCISEVPVWIGSMIISEWSYEKPSSSYCVKVIFLERLQGKFDVDHSWRVNGLTDRIIQFFPSVSCYLSFVPSYFLVSSSPFILPVRITNDTKSLRFHRVWFIL